VGVSDDARGADGGRVELEGGVQETVISAARPHGLVT
jgi:hypothetical protein